MFKFGKYLLSQYATEKGLQLHPLTLHFSGIHQHLEPLFQKDYFLNYLKLFRACHLFSIMFYGIFALVDYMVFPQQAGMLLLLRFGVVIPVFFLGYGVTYTAVYQHIWKFLNNFYIVLTGGSFLVMMVLCPPPLSYAYYVGVIICMFFGYTFIRSHLLFAATAGAILVAGYVVAANIINLSAQIFIVQFSFLVTANLLGMLICCSAEISARKDFFLRYLLEEEQARVEDSNANLERIVAERTSALSEINLQLKQEIEERKELETRLVQSQKMEAIGTLAGGIAHDFNNILTAIIGYADLARESCSPEMSDVRDDLDRVMTGANRAKELVKQILTFSRRGEKELKPVRFQSIVKEALKLLRSSIPATIEITSEIDQECPMILADPTELHQVVMNLCTNAYQAMKNAVGGKLHIVLRPYDERGGNTASRTVLLSVRDNGTGMSEEIQKRIFEPYFTSKAVGEGTGLGLAVVHGIVKACGGSIVVQSEVGKGSVFDLYFPVAVTRNSALNGQTQLAGELLRGEEVIMLVDDDPAIADVTRRALQKFGYTIQMYTDSEGALAAFEKHPDVYDLLLTDMTMPKLTGVDLCNRMRALRPDLPVVLCTGYSDAIDEDSARKIGITSFLVKPVMRTELLLTIKKELNH